MYRRVCGLWQQDHYKRMWTAFSPCHLATTDMTSPITTPSTEGIRLSKRVADILKCSRAEAEQVIVGGWVKVDNVVVDEPAHRVQNETIDVHSTAQRGKVPLLSAILHKTAGQSCLPQSHTNVWNTIRTASG